MDVTRALGNDVAQKREHQLVEPRGRPTTPAARPSRRPPRGPRTGGFVIPVSTNDKGRLAPASSLVEPRGLEPLTPCLQSRCATNCAMAPSSRADTTTGDATRHTAVLQIIQLAGLSVASAHRRASALLSLTDFATAAAPIAAAMSANSLRMDTSLIEWETGWWA